MKTLALAALGAPLRALLGDLEAGESLRIKDGDRTVATLVRDDFKLTPVTDEAEQERRHKAFMEELRARPALNLGPFNRDELYDRD